MTGDPALILLGKMFMAQTPTTHYNSLWNRPEGPGLEAIAEAFTIWD
jgi:hypothetical protein